MRMLRRDHPGGALDLPKVRRGGKAVTDFEAYKPFLEEVARSVDELRPVKVGVVMVMDNEVAMTCYLGVTSNTEKATMAYHMHMDAVMDAVFANARGIVDTAEGQEEEDEFEEE